MQYKSINYYNYYCLFTQLTGFGIAIQNDVDPNPENFVCAGIIKVKVAQIGCLLRLEPNRQAQVTMKSIHTVP